MVAPGTEPAADPDLVARPESGRVFRSQRRVRLADVTPTGRLRLDAIARMLQDVSSDDTADGSASDSDAESAVWVLRRLELRFGRLPTYRTPVEAITWCSGTGPRWAERRTDLIAGGTTRVRAAAIWACTDPATGAPVALPADFESVYGASAAGRRVRARLVHPEPPATAVRTPWRTRATDFDLLGHVNNASYWAPIEGELVGVDRPIVAAAIEFRGGVTPDDSVMIAVEGRPAIAEQLTVWWTVDDRVAASAIVRFGL